MQFTQEFSVPFARPVVWAAFQDLNAVATCLPGAQLTEPPRDGRLVGQVAVKLGPMVATFAGQGEVRFDDENFTGEITGSGMDRKSSTRARGNARFALMEADGGRSTTVRVEVDYQLMGALAQFSRGSIVQDLAARLTQAFAENLQRNLSSLAADPVAASLAPAMAPGGSTTDHQAATAADRPFDLGAVLWAALRRWIRRLFMRTAP